MATTQLTMEINDAIELAKDLFGFKSFRWINSNNLRLGKFWLAIEDDETEPFALSRCSIGFKAQPEGDELARFSDAFEAISELCGLYASATFQDCANALRTADAGGRA